MARSKVNPSCRCKAMQFHSYLEALKTALQLGDVGSLALQHISQAAYVGVNSAPWLVDLQAPSTPFSGDHKRPMLQRRHT